MELKFLGIGSAFNPSLGNTSAFWEFGNTLNFIDCGENIFTKIMELKNGSERDLFNNINNVNIFVTHLHFDHIGSLSSLIYYCHYVKGIRPKIIFPDKDLDIILRISGHNTSEYEYKMTNKFVTESYQVEFFENKHVNNLRSYGLIISGANYCQMTPIVYSGDTSEYIFKSISSNKLKGILNHKKIKVYHDVSNKIGVHFCVDELIEIIKSFNGIPNSVELYGMHFDCQETIDKCIENGIKIPEVIK